MAYDGGMIGKVIEQYRIERMLGQGGMAVVYEATDLKLKRQVAMKVMHAHLASQKSFRDLFINEARSAANLSHPNIVRVYGYNFSAEVLYIVMEMVTGGNLRKHVKRLAEVGQFIEYPEAVDIVRQLAAALHYAHERDMVHRDVKPDNVLLKPLPPQTPGINYRPLLTDFGLAKLTTTGDEAITAQQPIGTYPYMSPEQCNAESVDRRTDIYALGILLYELTVGRLPYNPKTIAEAARMHGREPLPLPSTLVRDFPEPLEQVIVKALAKDPADRYDTTADMAKQLTNFLNIGRLRITQSQPMISLEPDEDEYQTAVQTAVQEERMEPTIPRYLDVLFLDTGQQMIDHVAFYSRNESFAAPLTVDKEEITIGRDIDQDIQLSSETISRAHARIERKPNGVYYISDVGSQNGLFTEEGRLEVDEPVILNQDDVLRLGEYWMRFLPGTPIYTEDPPPRTDEVAALAQVADAAEEAEVPQVQPDAPPVDLPDSAYEGEPTQLFGIAPLSDMPTADPPKLNPVQLRFDRLVIYRKGEEPRLFLLEDDRYTVGRAEANTLVLDSPFVSKQHAILQREADGFYYVRDMDTLNGTWFDMERLVPDTPTRLNARRVLRMGDFWITFEAGRNLSAGVMSSGQVSSYNSSRIRNEFNDAIDTVQMIRPLDEDMPPMSTPPISRELQATDRLVFFSEDHPIQVEPLTKEIMTIGRGSNQDIRLAGKRVSREHAILELLTDGTITITDVDSRNGIWMADTLLVPGTPVTWPKREVIRMGNYWLKFERASTLMDPTIGRLSDRRGLIGRTIGPYRVDRFIGESALASVYKGTDLNQNRDVALKILKPERAAEPAIRQEFVKEAQMLSRLEHPNVLRVYTYDETGGELFMVQELITGGSLRRLLIDQRDRNTRMNLGDAVDMVVQLANGLHYAHQQGLIHRDVKPDNIMLKAAAVIGPIVNYEPILTDFKVAQQSRSDDIYELDENTERGYTYMSPEALLGERTDIRSDIYELGTTFYEMIVGRPPFQPNSIAEAVRMHTREKIAPPSEFRADVPPEIETVLLKALERSPNDRFQSAIDMARALQRASAVGGVEVTGVTGGSFIAGVQDENATAVMNAELPKEIPFMTQPPLPEGEVKHDRLVLYSEKYPTQVIDMHKPVMTVGRDPEQDVVLAGEGVSRRHVRIERSENGTYRLLDVGATNGVWLGSYKLIVGVLEIWDPAETVRLGDYWLRIETKRDLEDRKNLAFLPPTRQQAVEDADAEPAPNAQRPTPEHDKIGVTVTPRMVTVAPGSTAAVAVEVVNQNDFVDHFRVEVVGLPPEWVTQPPETLDLLPFNRETTSVTFHPPLSSASSSGDHAFEIRVSAQAKQISAVRTQCKLTVTPFHAFNTEIYPERVRNKGRVELTLRNTGNTHVTYNINARDREDNIRFQVEGGQLYTLPPGRTEDVAIQVAPRRRPLFGSAQFYPFEVVVTPPESSGIAPQTQNGELMVPPRLRLWAVGCAFISLLLCAGLIFGTLFFNRRQANIEATQVALADLTHIAETATAVIAGDDDGDGLSNAREAELGTRPDVADTDGDGLTDDVEVFVWQTNPLNRDTDGDTLTDGEEVNELGTNPLERDTDGDGIQDNEDPFPTFQSTPTPTPFPTVPGTAGDICPGSPAPSVIAVGMRAYVETGGVANRLRSEPSKNTGEIIDYMQPDEAFIVIGGPVCDEDDFIRWWQVDYNGIEGWTAEGEGEEYYLRPPGEDDGDGGSGSDAVRDSGSEGSINAADVVAALPAPGTVPRDPNTSGLQFFTNISVAEWDSAITAAEPLNMGWIKLQANWRFLQADGPGTSSGALRQFYAYIDSAKANGYNVMVSVAKAPDWARSTTVEAGPPDDPALLADFITQMLIESGGSIDAVEVWNEPNLAREWTGTLPMTGQGYMTLFDPVYTAVREISPDVVVVSAGLAPTSTTAGVSADDREFLRQMYAEGLANYENVAVGVHPFGWGNPPDVVCCLNSGQGWDEQPQFYFLNTIVDYRNIMLRFGDADADMWLTEFGWTTWADLGGSPPEPWMGFIGPGEQADYITRAFEVGQSLDYVGPMFLWNFNFANADTVQARNEIAGFSLTFTTDDFRVQPRPVLEQLVSR